MAKEIETISVSIQSPERVIWEGKAEAVSSINEEGPFDILPGHANFITLIQNSEVFLHFSTEDSLSFSFEQAVLYFRGNEAKIYIHTPEGVKSDKV